MYKRRSEKKRLRPATARRKYETELLRTRLEVQEQALAFMSGELQENIGQVLTGIQMKLMALAGRSTEKEEVEALSEMCSRMGKTIKDLRNLGNTLSGSMVEKIGLVEAVEKELAFTSSIYNLQCTFTYAAQLPGLNTQQDLLLFRIVQEAIHNIIRHARATAIDIRFDYRDRTLRLYIKDNGIGIDLEHYRGKGIGLQHIKDRIKLLKGNMEIKTKAGEGTMLILTCKPNYE